MFRRFLEWLENMLAGPTPMASDALPAAQVGGMTEDQVEKVVERRLADHTARLFTALQAAGVDVQALLSDFFAFETQVGKTVDERELAVYTARQALKNAEESFDRSVRAQRQLAEVASVMPDPETIPTIEI